MTISIIRVTACEEISKSKYAAFQIYWSSNSMQLPVCGIKYKPLKSPLYIYIYIYIYMYFVLDGTLVNMLTRCRQWIECIKYNTSQSGFQSGIISHHKSRYNVVIRYSTLKIFPVLGMSTFSQACGTYTQCAARVCTFCTHHVNILYSQTISTTLILTACDDDTTSCRIIVTNIVVAINAADGAIYLFISSLGGESLHRAS